MSSYKNVWKLSSNAQRELKRAVKTYLDDQLLKDIPERKSCYWDKTQYRNAVKSITMIKKSMCSSMERLCFVDALWVTIDIDKIKKEPTERKKQELCNKMVQSQTTKSKVSFTNDSKFRKCQEHAPHKIRYLMVDVGIMYSGLGGHACLLLFDFKRKHQIFFDPADMISYRGLGCSSTIAFQSHAIIPGFKPVPIEECAGVFDNKAFQNCFENDVHKGQCGVMTTLIAICCNRFNYYHMKNMADTIIRVYDTPAKRKLLTAKMIGLLCAYSEKKLPAERVLPDTVKCKSFCMSTRRFCNQPSCPGGTYCWVHRQLYVNPFSKRMDCKSRIVERPFDTKNKKGWLSWMFGSENDS